MNDSLCIGRPLVSGVRALHIAVIALISVCLIVIMYKTFSLSKSSVPIS